MWKIKFVNEVGGKKSILFGIAVVSILMSFLIILISIKPESANLIGVIGTITLTGVTAIVLFLTLQTYVDILDVSKHTLSFTKNQSTYNSFLDNFKLFNDLAKRNISIIYGNDGIQEKYSKFFQNLTFDTIYSNYKNILLNYTALAIVREDKRIVVGRTPEHIRYKKVFTRYSDKVQAFIDALFNELLLIRDDKELSQHQKVTLIQLYANFILSDYLHLAVELKDEIERHKSSPILVSDLLKCNDFGNIQDNLEFDEEWFLTLVDMVDIKTIEEDKV